MATKTPRKPASGSKPAPKSVRAVDALTGELFTADADGAPPPPPAAPDATDDDSLPLAQFAERSYLEYAMSVVMGRALPDVADGQKPVQRRILYAMHELGLYAPARHVKSARVVGDVLGKYHPHGDTAAYDALVRQAQDFRLRYPLIDGQGNFGSRDGDNAAAMRYTECRLTPIAELLLAEIDRDTVDFAPNYDGAFKEPKLLPARLPMLLLNGTSGIGVGMATDIPSHNLGEVARAVVADDPQSGDHASTSCWRIIPGPDLPGGGQIISGAARRFARSTKPDAAACACARAGRSRSSRAASGASRSPSCRSACRRASVLEDIERATNPKPKEGKKALSQEQLNLKNLMLSALDTVRDESDKTSPVRIVLEPKSSRQDRAGVHEPAARQHAARSKPADQPRAAGPRRAAAVEAPEADDRRVDRSSASRRSRAARGIGSAKSTAASTFSKAGSSRCCRSTR